MAYLITSRSDGKIPQTIATAKVVRRRVKPNKEAVKQVIDQIKAIMAREKDPTNKKHLAEAGLALNRIFIR